MFNPSQITLGEVSSTIRDLSVVVGIFGIAWKSRGWLEAAKKFFERLTTFMDTVENDSAYIRQGMHTLLSNHLTHIEADLKKMTHRQVRATDEEQDLYKTDDLLET